MKILKQIAPFIWDGKDDFFVWRNSPTAGYGWTRIGKRDDQMMHYPVAIDIAAKGYGYTHYTYLDTTDVEKD